MAYWGWDEDKEWIAIQAPELYEARDNTQVLEKEVETQGYHSNVTIEYEGRPWYFVDIIVPGIFTTFTVVRWKVCCKVS